MRFTVMNVCSGKETKDVSGKPFTEEIRHVTHGPPQPSQ